MKVGTLLLILHDVIESLVGLAVLDMNGNFASPNLDMDLKIVVKVEEALKAHGVTTPDEVDRVIKALPLFLALVR